MRNQTCEFCAVERELTVEWVPICHEVPELAGSVADRSDSVWFRNILLNGECYSLSGETLAASGRWSQLLRYGSCPQVVSHGGMSAEKTIGFAEGLKKAGELVEATSPKRPLKR